MMMKMLGFRVQSFRSVVDSGWISAGDVTALIGTNESGKTNLLVPLWKLNPAKEGEINLLQDLPRKRYHEMRDLEEKPVFISARFELDDALTRQVAAMTGLPDEHVREVVVSRDFDGGYDLEFAGSSPTRTIDREQIHRLFSAARADLDRLAATKTEESLKEEMLAILADTSDADSADAVGEDTLNVLRQRLEGVDLTRATKHSVIRPRFEQVIDALDEWIGKVQPPSAEDVEAVQQLVLQKMPKFVYYSNYGNLDSEIYLPHVLQNLRRTDLGPREEAKARTLKVLFDFVRLSPKEILELGKEEEPVKGGPPTDAQIKLDAEKKKEREVLLQSASGSLTERFREWWKQGDYRFRFHADGNHFRIWVSDQRRPEEVELEGRSTGLQWFLSFYLVFLVESQDAHAGTILLLDEAGLSLHPLAQKDLSSFFEGLATTNQLVYTTHSPFLVDPDHLDRVKAVYVDSAGSTAVSSDLRAAEKLPDATKSIYAVHAALGLSVSEALLHGCQPVIVEGASDQLYLSAIKIALIGRGRIHPSRELVFPPSGGVRGINAVVPVITAKDEALPFIVLDSDRSGRDMANKLKSGLYQGNAERIIEVGELVGMENAEVEDLFPGEFLAQLIDRYLPRPAHQEDDFTDFYTPASPIVPQVEAYATEKGIELELGWKVEVARMVKAQILRKPDIVQSDGTVVELWEALFQRFLTAA